MATGSELINRRRELISLPSIISEEGIVQFIQEGRQVESLVKPEDLVNISMNTGRFYGINTADVDSLKTLARIAEQGALTHLGLVLGKSLQEQHKLTREPEEGVPLSQTLERLQRLAKNGLEPLGKERAILGKAFSFEGGVVIFDEIDQLDSAEEREELSTALVLLEGESLTTRFSLEEIIQKKKGRNYIISVFLHGDVSDTHISEEVGNLADYQITAQVVPQEVSTGSDNLIGNPYLDPTKARFN
ncbi:MAG: hypothetical protein Q8P92_00570 [Candidatus Daviesbacteria bacterium]|nr:hypothetical protein [Candidatus Daviesbacteria bacterium]